MPAKESAESGLVGYLDNSARTGQIEYEVAEVENCLADIDVAIKQKNLNPGVTFSWGQLIATMAVPIILFAVYIGSLGSDIKGLRHDVDQVSQRIDDIWKTLPSLRASAASNRPSDPANQQAAKNLIAEARHQAIPPIPVSSVQDSGQKFVDASATSPTAWDVALDFLNYRSVLNQSEFTPSLASTYAPLEVRGTYYRLNRVAGMEPPRGFAFGSAPKEESFLAEPIDTPLPKPTPKGLASVLLVGGAVQLDNMRLRHVVLQNVEIHYSGGPLILEDVLFVNCKMVIDNNQNGRLLASGILESSRTKISLS